MRMVCGRSFAPSVLSTPSKSSDGSSELALVAGALTFEGESVGSGVSVEGVGPVADVHPANRATTRKASVSVFRDTFPVSAMTV
jgi:hypothetical protein